MIKPIYNFTFVRFFQRPMFVERFIRPDIDARAAKVFKVRILLFQAPCSERRCLPNGPLMVSAAKVSEEPEVADAAACRNVGLFRV